MGEKYRSQLVITEKPETIYHKIVIILTNPGVHMQILNLLTLQISAQPLLVVVLTVSDLFFQQSLNENHP